MSDAITGLVRLIHIFFAVAWVGGVFFWSMLIAPRLLRDGPPPIRRPVAEAVIPAITRFFKVSAVLALASGIVLVGMIWGWAKYFDAFQAGGGYGPALSIGALAAIGMAIVGFGIVAPTGQKMLATMQGIQGPPTPAQQAELAALGKKSGMMGMVVTALGSIAIVGMVWAVNAIR